MKRKKILLIFALYTSSLGRHTAAANEHAARKAMKEAFRHYSASNYEAAAKAFADAAQAATDTRLDPTIARYNEATARLALGQLETSALQAQEALRSPDLEMQYRAHFNRGLALYEWARALAESNDYNTAAGAIENALDMFENATLLKNRDIDSKINYELALKLKDEITKKQQQQEQRPQTDSSQQKKEAQGKEHDQSTSDAQQPEPQGPQPQKTEPQESKEQTQQNESQSVKAQEMTREEAERILDAMKQEEDRRRAALRKVHGEPIWVEKDW